MRYQFGKKNLVIPDADIAQYRTKYGMTEAKAIQMWLEDEGYLDNEEEQALTQKAKDNHITATIHDAGDKVKRKKSSPRTVKVSDEKQALFAEIIETLEVTGYSHTILKENKLIEVKIGEKIFKIDLIEQRTKKN